MNLVTKNKCAAEMKVIKHYAFHFTFGLDGPPFVSALYEKYIEANGVSKALPSTMFFSIVIIEVFFVSVERVRRNV